MQNNTAYKIRNLGLKLFKECKEDITHRRIFTSTCICCILFSSMEVLGISSPTRWTLTKAYRTLPRYFWRYISWMCSKITYHWVKKWHTIEYPMIEKLLSQGHRLFVEYVLSHMSNASCSTRHISGVKRWMQRTSS